MRSFGMHTNELAIAEQEKMFFKIKTYIESENKLGNERRIISIGQNLVNYDFSIQKAYIEVLCKSDYPITAAMTLNSMHHEDIDALKEIIIRNVENSEWSLYDKIISCLYIKNKDKLDNLFNSDEDIRKLSQDFEKISEHLISESEYELVFQLFYSVAKSRHSLILSRTLYNFQINEFYINKHNNIIQDTARILYERKDYDSLFMLCKNLNLIKHLKMILKKSPDELEKKFINSDTINGVRLAFRVIQQELKDDEKAYRTIISKISKTNESDDIKYIYFCYLLKLILLQKEVNPEIEEHLLHIGEVKLLKVKGYGISLLGKCLETVLINQGFEAYNKLIDILEVNNIFKYEKKIPELIPFSIYNQETLENIIARKQYIQKLKLTEACNEKGLFYFYMNSFYKCFISLQDFFDAVYGKKEDRIYLKKLFSGYVFYGKVKSIDTEKRTAQAICLNAAVKGPILLTEKEVGENHINLLMKEDEFSFRLNKFDPRIKTISIANFKLLDVYRQKQFDNVDISYFKVLKCCLEEIIKTHEFSHLLKEKIEAIPHVEFKKLNLSQEYLILYSEVLYSLRYKAQEIIEFINTLEKHRNNLFNVDSAEPLMSINRTNELLKMAEETTECIKRQHITEEDLIWIYVNSYLRLTVKVQFILESMLKPGEKTLRLDSTFYEYRFYGFLSDYIHTNEKGIKSGYVRTKSIGSFGNMSFILDKESGITDKMIEEKCFVSFKLRKYFKINNKVAIEDVRGFEQNNPIKPQNWSVLHNCNKVIKFHGRVFKETLEELSRLPKLNFSEAEGERFYHDYFWCMINLSKNEEDLYLYIKALELNNPFIYKVGQTNKILHEAEAEINMEQSSTILQQLIKNKYNLYKVIWIYLNSYLNRLITIDDAVRSYYENCSLQKKSKIHYMPIKVQEILFLADVSAIKENMLILNLKQVSCKCTVCVRIEKTDSEMRFKENQEITITLSEYHEDENIIYAELYEE